MDKKIAKLEEAMIEHNSPLRKSKLNKVKVEYLQVMKAQDVALRQKTKANWLKYRDKNAAYFRSVIKGRRKRLNIRRI